MIEPLVTLVLFVLVLVVVGYLFMKANPHA